MTENTIKYNTITYNNIIEKKINKNIEKHDTNINNQREYTQIKSKQEKQRQYKTSKEKARK